MGAAGKSGAETQRRRIDLVHAQKVQASDGADDIGDGVEGADLVQMDFFGWQAVDFGLGRGEAAVYRDGTFDDGPVERAVFDAFQDVGQMVVGAVLMAVLVGMLVFAV